MTDVSKRADGAVRTWAAIARNVFAGQCGEPVAHGHVDATEFVRFQEVGAALAALERAMSPEAFEAHLAMDRQYGDEWPHLIPLICGWRLWKAGIRSGADRVEYLAQADSCAECGATDALHLHHSIQRPPLEWLAADSVFVLCEPCHTKTHGGDL